MTIKPKQLRKIDTGAVFTYTDVLAKRSDMTPIWPDGINPNSGEPDVATAKIGLNVETASDVTGRLRTQMHEKDKLILTMQRQLDAMADENAKLLGKVSSLEEALAGASKEPAFAFLDREEPAAAETDDPISSEERTDKLFAAVEKIYEGDNRNHFTGQGKPRIPIIEEMSGLDGVSAAERDAVLATLGKD